MDIRTLRYFVHVAELKSFSRAASAARVSQPALSRQIRSLEAELHGPLFARHARGVALTARGTRLLDGARLVLSEFDELSQDDVPVPTGHVAIAVSPAIGSVLVAPLVQRYRQCYPAVTLQVLQGYSSYVEDALLAGHADLAVMSSSSTCSRDIEKVPLVRQSCVLIGPARRGEERVSCMFRDLATLPLILPSRANGFRQLIESLAISQGFHLQVEMEVDGMTTIRHLVALGVGYSVIPFHSVRDDVAAGKLFAAPITDPTVERLYVLATQHGRPRSTPASLMIQSICEVAGKLVESGDWPDAVSLLDFG